MMDMNLSYMTHITTPSNSSGLYDYILPLVDKLDEFKNNITENYDKSEIIVINQNNTNYKFRLLDLIKLWKIALYNSQNMFPQPIKLKNPFTNIEFSNSS